jgi:hypothetical protein
VLLFQHPILVLVFKQKLCHSLTRWFDSVFFFCLSKAAAWSCPPLVGCGSLYVVLIFQNQLCSPPAVLLWNWVFTVLDYWGLLSAITSPPFLWGKVVICQPAPYCQCVVMVCWLFFNFVVLFDFQCCSLAEEMSFVDCFLPYFRQQLITRPLSALLPFQALCNERSCRDHLLASFPFSGVL